VTIVGVVIPASIAGAAGTSTGGKAKLWVTPSGYRTSAKHPGKVVLTGAIADYGTSVNATASGKPTTKQSTYELLKLTQGTIVVNTAALTQSLSSASPSTVDTTTCSFVLTGSGAITVVKGTGAYSGLTGSFTATGTIAADFAKKKSGCTSTKKPPGYYFSVEGSGTVSL
jgi:hypothetical protein